MKQSDSNMHPSPVNPSILFYKAYQSQILKVRESLFSELDKVSSNFSFEARKILEEKLKTNREVPLLGELFPWIIKDLIEADETSTHNVSVGWLALYLYTIFLDDYVDNPKPLSSQRMITSSLLAKEGLLRISKLTNDSIYEKYIDNALSFSAKNEYADVMTQGEITDDSQKVFYSEGKNYVLLACAGALAAQNCSHGEFITNLSRALLLTLQFLDDISDFDDDFNNKNLTVLLNEAIKNNTQLLSHFAEFRRRDILQELVATGALVRVVNKIECLLNDAVKIIKNENLNNSAQKESSKLFNSLITYVSLFNAYLKQNSCDNYRKSSDREKQNVLDKVESYIKIIAQST